MTQQNEVVARWYNGLGPALEVLEVNDGVRFRWSDEEEVHEREIEYTPGDEEEDEEAGRAYIEFNERRWFLDECIRVGTPWG